MKLTPFCDFNCKKRFESKLSFEDHAAALGVSSDYLCSMEIGSRDLDVKFIELTANFLKLNDKEIKEFLDACEKTKEGVKIEIRPPELLKRISETSSSIDDIYNLDINVDFEELEDIGVDGGFDSENNDSCPDGGCII